VVFRHNGKEAASTKREEGILQRQEGNGVGNDERLHKRKKALKEKTPRADLA
jgi:hypothetical protein